MSIGIICQEAQSIQFTIDNNSLITEAGEYHFKTILQNKLPLKVDTCSTILVIGDTFDKKIVKSLLGDGECECTKVEKGISLYEVPLRTSQKDEHEGSHPNSAANLETNSEKKNKYRKSCKVYEVSYEADALNWKALSRVLCAMAKNEPYIPYRDTALTMMLWPESVKNMQDSMFTRNCGLEVFIHLPMSQSDQQSVQFNLAKAFHLWVTAEIKALQIFVPKSTIKADLETSREAVKTRVEKLKTDYLAEFLPLYESQRAFILKETKDSQLKVSKHHQDTQFELNAVLFDIDRMDLEKKSLQSRLKCHGHKSLSSIGAISQKVIERNGDESCEGAKVPDEANSSHKKVTSGGTGAAADNDADVTIDPWELLFSGRERELQERIMANRQIEEKIASIAYKVYEQLSS